MIDQKLIKLQEIEFEILLKTIEILNKYNLRYFLISGTLLGAVRHKGYIPWDDDIDIALPREDFDKFEKLASNEFHLSGYFCQSIKTHPEYPYWFIKIRKDNTLFLQSSLKHLNMHHGIFIDVFPLDGCGNDLKKSYNHCKKIRLLNYLYTSDILIKNKYSNKLKSIAAYSLFVISRIVGKKIHKKQDKKINL